MLNIPGKNIATKILALVLAAILWIYVTNEQNPPIESSFTVPVEMRNLTGSLLAIDAPDTVRIKVRGPRSVVAGVLAKDIKAFLDVKGLGEGKHSLKIQAALPPNLELVDISPDKAQLRLDTVVSQAVPLEIRVNGTPAVGATLAKTAANPAQITVEGPKSLLSGLDKVVAAVDVGGKKADFTADASVRVLGKDGKELEGVTLSQDSVTIAVTFTQNVIRRQVDVKTVIVGQLASGVTLKSLTTDPPRVMVEGPQDLVGKLESVSTDPISLADVTKDTAVSVNLQKIESITVTPVKVTARIAVNPAAAP